MNRKLVKSLIDTAQNRELADLCLKNINVVDVYNKEVFISDVYIKNGYFCSFSNTEAKETIDYSGKYLIPGFIDAHCHIESSHLSPAAFSDAVIPCGTTTVIADPHEIANVAGLEAMDYMIKAAANIPLSVYYMFPSCVPCTQMDNAGAVLLAEDIKKLIDNDNILGLGEMMNYPGVINAYEFVLDKLEVAYKSGKIIDGHAPNIFNNDLDAYTAANILTDHECETPEDLKQRVKRGVYVMLRQGTACKNVEGLLPGVSKENSQRVLFCTDDRQPQSIIQEGHINYGVNLAIKAGIDPLYAISMASLNASVCYNLKDRGAIAPGKRADCFITSSLDNIQAEDVFILGQKLASNGSMLKKAEHFDSSRVSSLVNVANFSKERLKLKLSSQTVRVIGIQEGGVVTSNLTAKVSLDKDGYYINNDNDDILKIAVVERHKGLGNVGIGLISGYGAKYGAVATSISHDSHNIIVVGQNDSDMVLAIEELIKLGGGITIVKNGSVLASHQLEIAGLMTERSAEDVCKELESLHNIANKELEVNQNIDPFMTLCFMSLIVIPELKLTDTGLFDVVNFTKVPLEI